MDSLVKVVQVVADDDTRAGTGAGRLAACRRHGGVKPSAAKALHGAEYWPTVRLVPPCSTFSCDGAGASVIDTVGVAERR